MDPAISEAIKSTVAASIQEGDMTSISLSNSFTTSFLCISSQPNLKCNTILYFKHHDKHHAASVIQYSILMQEIFRLNIDYKK